MISGVIGMMCFFIVLKIDIKSGFEMFISVLGLIVYPLAVRYLFAVE